MRWGAVARALIAFTVLVVLHFTLRPLLGWWAPMDFLVIALMLVAVRVRPGLAAVIGFALGLTTDALRPGAFGSGALAMTTVGFGASWLKAVFFADNLALNGFFFFLGKWGFDLIDVLTQRQMRGVELVMQLLVRSPLSAAATAVAGVLMLFLLRPILEGPSQ